jgi:hypothetical protein
MYEMHPALFLKTGCYNKLPIERDRTHVVLRLHGHQGAQTGSHACIRCDMLLRTR